MIYLQIGSSEIVAASLGVFSTLIITKDEWVHKELSTGFENWLHAMLFITHAALVISVFLLWRQGELSASFLRVMTAGIGGFFAYQLIQGGMRWKTA